MLIQELERAAEKAKNTEDVSLIKEASVVIGDVVKAVNEATRAAEERQRILQIGSTIEFEEVFLLL
jgi:hypothetical protein